MYEISAVMLLITHCNTLEKGKGIWVKNYCVIHNKTLVRCSNDHWTVVKGHRRDTEAVTLSIGAGTASDPALKLDDGESERG